MDYTIQLVEDRKLIIATASGDWEQEADNAMVRQIMDAVTTSGLDRVLVDIRELKLDIPLVQIFERAKEMRERRKQAGVTSARAAVVYPPNDPKMEQDFNFFETAARNRGLPYRAFSDIDDAMAWLMEE
jgi:hypothetical protein